MQRGRGQRLCHSPGLLTGCLRPLSWEDLGLTSDHKAWIWPKSCRRWGLLQLHPVLPSLWLGASSKETSLSALAQLPCP